MCIRDSNMYSALAGFLEPGETIESAVIREVKEEVNLKISKKQKAIILEGVFLLPGQKLQLRII